jgi:hypothetical protein
MRAHTPFTIFFLAGVAFSANAQVRDAQTHFRDPEYQMRLRQLIDDERALIRAGLKNWRTAISPLSVDDRMPVTKPRSRAYSSTLTRAHNVNQPWGALIDSDDFVLDFEGPEYQITSLNPTTLDPFISLSAVVHSNGDAWMVATSAEGYVGIVDNAAAQTGPRWDPDGADNNPLTEGGSTIPWDYSQHGEIGGPDPLGLHGKFVAAAAGSMATQPHTGGSRLEGWLTHKFYAPTPTVPVTVLVDVYQDRAESAFWYAPLSETEGNLFVTSIFFFGYDFSFDGCSFIIDPFCHIIDRPLILGASPGNPSVGIMFLHPRSSPWRLKTDEWISIGIRLAADSYSFWVRDSSTIGVNGFVQNSIYDGIIGNDDPGNTKGAFAGEVFESDWLQIQPGVDDDSGTPIIEGYGTSSGQLLNAVIADVVIDNSGSPAGIRIATSANGIDALHFRGGFDPSLSNVPLFQPNDRYLDNYVVLGVPFFNCASDITGDDQTNGADLGLLLGGWGLPGITDLNGDGTTNGADLGLLLGTWGPCP